MRRLVLLSRTAALALGLAVLGSSAVQAQQPGLSVRVLDMSSSFSPQVLNQNVAHDVLFGDLGELVPKYSGLVEHDYTGVVPAIDFTGSVPAGGNNIYDLDLPYPGHPGSGQVEHMAMSMSANLTIPEGTYQFGVGSDDGFSVTIPGATFSNVQHNPDEVDAGSAADLGLGDDSFAFIGGRGTIWSVATFTVPAGGLDTTINGTFHEGTGGDSIEWAIRDASGGEVTPDWAVAPNIDPANGWNVFQDGALPGLSVTTDQMIDRRDLAGRGVIDRSEMQGEFRNQTFLPPTSVEGVVEYEIYQPDNTDRTRAGFEAYVGDNEPTQSGLMEGPINWNNGNYPDAWSHFFPSGSNQANFSVLHRGQIFITDEIIDFKDGVDDYALLVIDTNGDGNLADEDAIIDDNDWTGVDTTANNGSPVSLGIFNNLAAGGEWRDFIFGVAEGGGGDSGVLYWSANEGAAALPGQGEATGAEHLIPASSLRVADLATIIDTADRVVDLSASMTVFDVDVAELEWDKVVMEAPPEIVGNDNAQLHNVVSFEDGIVRLELNADPTPGLVVDLVDNEFVDEIVGPVDFEFSHGDPGMWDTSAFTESGQLAFMGTIGPPDLAGDYNGSGSVEQGDLNLVLLNWGTEGTPDNWVSQPPMGIVDQAELNEVLLNWGETAGGLGGAAAVPEPSSIALLLVAAGLGFGLIRRKR